MLYEDTSKPVPGLAEIQTSGKPKQETKETLLLEKETDEDLEPYKEESKTSVLEANKENAAENG